MKITSVQSRFEPVPLSRPYTIAFRTIDAVDMGLVEIHTDAGLVGRGCASPERFVTGETDEGCRAALDESGLEWLVGQDIRSAAHSCRALGERMADAPAARAALDMALHDLFAQHLGLPLVEVLGRAHERLLTSITIGIMPTEEALAEADEYMGRGFRVLKIKLGHALEEDIERITRLRERVGPDVPMRVDPNQGYSADQLKQFVAATEKVGVEFFEQPMPVDQVAAMRELPESIKRLLAADESLLNERNALDLVAPPRACGIFNIKLMKCGGVMPARRIADIADIAGVELMWGCMDESIISISAALHAALASPATRYLDLDGSLDLARDVVDGGFVLEDGYMRTTDAPGLGLSPL